ncbi:MAG: type III-B CRISPR module-associated protein Cmr5 [Bacteroidota bacterium]
MNRIIETLIPHAIDVVQDSGISRKGEVDPEFKGYIASFAASIIQAGLLPAVIFFEDEDTNSQKDRFLVPKAVLMLLLKSGLLASSMQGHKRLSKYILATDADYVPGLQQKILHAAVAIKLAIRTYPKKTQNALSQSKRP